MSDLPGLVRAFQRIFACVFCCTALSLSYSDLSFADDTVNEIKFVAEDKANFDRCHPIIKLTQPTESWTARILDPVKFQLVETHDAECQAEIIIKQSPMYSCTTPQIQQTMTSTPEGLLRTQNDVTLVCRYRQHGYFISTPFIVRFTLAEQAVSNFNASLPAIHIELDQLSPEEAADRHTLRPWHRRLSPLFWFALIALITCIGVMIAVIHKRSAHQAEAQNVEPEIIPPSELEIFNAKIASLLEEQPEDEDSLKRYFDTLSEAIRRYLSTKLDLPIMESTTGQLRSLINDALIEGHVDEIVRILQECDLIKFARMIPAPAKRLTLIRDTSHIVAAIDAHLETFTQSAAIDNCQTSASQRTSKHSTPTITAQSITPIQADEQRDEQPEAQPESQPKDQQVPKQASIEASLVQSFEPPAQPKIKERLMPLPSDMPAPINSADLPPQRRQIRESVSRAPVRLSISSTSERPPVHLSDYVAKVANVPLITAESLANNTNQQNTSPRANLLSLNGKLSTLSNDSASELSNVNIQLSSNSQNSSIDKELISNDENESGRQHIQRKALLSLAHTISEDVVSVRTTTPKPLHLTPNRDEGLNFFTPQNRIDNKDTPI